VRNPREQVRLLDTSRCIIYVIVEAVFFARRVELVYARMRYCAIAEMMYLTNVHVQFMRHKDG